LPQQYPVPVVETPHEWKSPPLTVAHVTLLDPTGVATAAGVRTVAPSDAVPLPTWPIRLSPQQYASPALVTAQVWRYADATFAQLMPPETSAGVTRSVTVPSPICPDVFDPQQKRCASVSIAQVWLVPVLMLDQDRWPLTTAGVYEEDVEPVPS